ncbi:MULTISPECIES: hypothetical protein [unclassified Burkholderia]|uniref:hypothetical protein n=1 Tax=unclassified Burkholderia TaxID=2613784 RepID=UPI000B7ADFA5|nr:MULTISPECIES: hypothetical protein [unclassified Burkholderia]MBR8234220.1 hypothetical protein [Burkholderia sp. AU32357]OXI45291.1 hypothetical protein CFB49_09730 [Burkholderia sp. AU17457]
MIFDISPTQIESLNSLQLVELLRKLLHAEAQSAGIALRGVSVPLQITIADGGEDARVQWNGGNEDTDYLPCRMNVFQSKATDPEPAGWKREVWTKASQREGVPRVLNDAVSAAIAARGAYIGFTSAAIVGNKLTRRIAGIREGIREAGANPDDLIGIAIYDANQIAAWASQHPSVAVWLNEAQTGLPLGGFQTIDSWGGRADFATIKFVDDEAPRYDVGESGNGKAHSGDVLNSHQARERIFEHIAEPKRCVRVIGPSGIGKSRFVYELFRDRNTLERVITGVSAIYCDFRSIGQERLLQVVEAMAGRSVPALVVVDECPRESASVLADIVSDARSRLRLITIDIDDRTITAESVLNISVSRSDDALVEGIIRQRAPTSDGTTISYLKNLSGGFPRIAVLATDNHLGGMPALKSMEDVVERVLTGCGVGERDQVRAIECLALFERVGAEDNVAGQLDLVAERLARQSGDEMYEHLSAASKHELVDRRGPFFRAQPLPIAAFLGARRIELLRTETIIHFIESAPNELVVALLEQWRYFDRTRTAVSVAERLVGREGRFGTLAALSSEFGAQCLHALCHVAPNACAETVRRVFGELPLDELRELGDGRRFLVHTLERLVFRHQSFRLAAHLLMRLAAVETENWSNNATGQFKQLLQIDLSGTEAEPSERFAVIDHGIASGDERIIAVCIDALEVSLGRTYSSRIAGAEEIGSQPPLRDWHPQTWEEVFDFHRRSLATLERIRSTYASFESRCDEVLATSLRGIICEPLITEIETAANAVAQRRGVWLEGIRAVGSWLYFDRKAYPEELQGRVRVLYDKLMPTDLIQLALLYTKFWASDLYDPDLEYDQSDDATLAFDYSSRKAKEVAVQIAQDDKLVARAVLEMAPQKLNNSHPFGYELARNVADPLATFKLAVEIISTSANLEGLGFLRGLLGGIDDRDSDVADECVRLALECDALRRGAIDIYTAVKVSAERLTEIVESVKAGTLAAAHCVYLSYGQGLAHLSANQILPLVDELANNHKGEGVWSALEIITMYQHGRTVFDSDLVERSKSILVSSTLVGEVRRGNRNGYLFENMVRQLNEHAALDDRFAAKLGEQFVRLCVLSKYDAFDALDDAVRKVVKLLVTERPLELWEVVARFVERATPTERSRLTRLVGQSSRGFRRQDDSENGAGPLYGIPESECFAWADADAPNRSPFLCEFYPLLDKDDAGNMMWNPAMERLAARYGEHAAFRDALTSRLHIGAWSGSLIPYLEAYFAPLEVWYRHTVFQLAQWAKETRRALDVRIASAKQMEGEES